MCNSICADSRLKIRYLYDKNGNILAEYAYDAYGKHLSETARRSWEYVDSNMVNGLTDQEIQYKLTYDSDFNIKTVVAVLLYEAKELGIIEDVSDAKNITMEEWKQIVAEYNGSDEYANKVFEYLEDADELLD